MTCELTEVALGHRLVLMYDLIDLDSRDKADIPVSLESKMDQLESAFLFWKNSYSELNSPSAKFLAYMLDNTYGEQKMSQSALEGDDIQRVNDLAGMCSKHGFCLYLAEVIMRLRPESHEGPTEKTLELQKVVRLSGTRLLARAPWTASQIVQPDLSNVFDTEDVSRFIGNCTGGIVQVDIRFVS